MLLMLWALILIFGWGSVDAACESSWCSELVFCLLWCDRPESDRGWLADRGRIQNADRLLAFWFLWPISFANCGRSHWAPKADLDGNFADLTWGAFQLPSSFAPGCNFDASADVDSKLALFSAVWLMWACVSPVCR
ncbi:hypothetical protein Nepgr_022933 [Nepenthes gracilis]|uniref:Secreted protein n=1 Tax=Nepenthes gracilis TaxID=150966 RepID=A0AAD3XYW0_NEPGR|nr:hypothetical protein Nepgr_022933 [Nepenthes gracilis]